MQEGKDKKDFKNETASELGVQGYTDIDKGSHKLRVIRNVYVNSVNSLSKRVKILLILSWVSAALTAFISPYFSIPGIILGYLASRIIKGVGTAAILTNVVLGVLNLILSILFLYSLQNLFVK